MEGGTSRHGGKEYQFSAHPEQYGLFRGYVKWFTDMPAVHQYPVSLFFPGTMK